MSPIVSRRGFAKAGAAALGATVAGIPVSARAIADHDASLFAALARYDEARAAWLATDPPLDEAMERAHTAYPPRPSALDTTFADTMLRVNPRGRERRPNGTLRGFYTQDDVAQLREMGPVMRVKWFGDGPPPPPVPCPEGEARRQEVIHVFDAWMAECAVVDDATGFTAAIRANIEACRELDAVEDEVERLCPRTLAGIVAKARWAASAFQDCDSTDTLERFVRQVAAFGEVET